MFLTYFLFLIFELGIALIDQIGRIKVIPIQNIFELMKEGNYGKINSNNISFFYCSLNLGQHIGRKSPNPKGIDYVQRLC